MNSSRITWWLAFGTAMTALPVSAQVTGCTDRARCGELSPLIPMQSTEAVHMGLVWKRGSDAPKLLFHSRFPEYGFANHKGYSTPEHIEALRCHGPCTIHRRSFRPVWELLFVQETIQGL